MSKLTEQYPETFKLFNQYGDSVVKEMKTRLRKAGKTATETLYDSLAYEVLTEGQVFELDFLMEDYGDFVDKGRNGKLKRWRKDGSSNPKFPPRRSIKQWMKVKGIDEKFEYPIVRKIGLFGIAPTNFFTISTTRRAEKFYKDVEKAMAIDIENFVSN